jgi:hypothetical protein
MGALLLAAAAAGNPMGTSRDCALTPPTLDDPASVLEFLREAEIVQNEGIEVGVTGARRLTLVCGDTRLRAAFRNVDETQERYRMPDGTFYQRLRDFSGYEVAAYRLSRLLAMDSVPPAVHRRVDGEPGTVQLWIEDAMMEQDRVAQKLYAPEVMSWVRQEQEMLAFDELAGNIDRNGGNFIIDPDWKIWLVDHSRAFQQGDELRDPARIRMVRRGFLDALRALSREAVEEAISHDVDRRGINDLMDRRELLLAHFERLIEERGEGAVVWE